MVRVVIFASGQLDKIGGIQRSYQVLTNHLVDNDWKVMLYGFASTLSGKADPKSLAYPLSEKVDVEIIDRPKRLKSYECLREKVSSFSPDVALIVNSGRVALFYLALVKDLGIPNVYSMRGSTEYCLKYLWTCKALFDLQFLLSDASHVLMPSYKKILPEKVRHKVTVIPSQIATALSYARPDISFSGKYTVLFSGRLTFEKQVEFLIDAFASLVDDYPDWELLILGYGPLEEELKTRASYLGISDSVRWMAVSNTEEAYNIYKQAHLLVLPSEYEGCPMALREAMAHGLPVIAYDTCTGSNEIIEHGVDGLLAKSENPIQGLRDSMDELMGSPERRLEMGKHGIEKATMYLPGPINENWEMLLISVLKDKVKKKANPINIKEVDFLKNLVINGTYRTMILFRKNEAVYRKYRNEFLTIYGHRLFDDRYYLETYLDVKVSGQDPLLHYISEGWKLGYNPSPEFDTNRYQALYMDDKSLCPLVHFYTQGAFEGCFPPQADQSYYEKWPGRKPKEIYSIIDDLNTKSL